MSTNTKKNGIAPTQNNELHIFRGLTCENFPAGCPKHVTNMSAGSFTKGSITAAGGIECIIAGMNTSRSHAKSSALATGDIEKQTFLVLVVLCLTHTHSY